MIPHTIKVKEHWARTSERVQGGFDLPGSSFPVRPSATLLAARDRDKTEQCCQAISNMVLSSVEYEVILLEQAEAFLNSLPKKLYGKTLYVIDLLGQFGPYLAMPHSRKLKGHDLWELRVQQGSDICRLFYFYNGAHVYIVTSGYRKKTQRTSVREIERAKHIRNEFLAGRQP